MTLRDPQAEHRAAAHELVERLAAHVKLHKQSVAGNVLRVVLEGRADYRQRAVFYRGMERLCRLRATMVLTTHVHERQFLARKIAVDK